MRLGSSSPAYDTNRETVFTTSSRAKRTYAIVTTLIALVVATLLGYALIQVIAKLKRERHKPAFYSYHSKGLPEGKIVRTFQRDVMQYLGIRYATHLSPANRFDKSVPEPPLRATSGKGHKVPACAQPLYSPFPSRPLPKASANDDCLFLNIWVPLTKNGGRTRKPVAVLLVGGNFVAGGGGEYEFYDGAAMAALWDHVVVVPNYRVGILGFLKGTSEDPAQNNGIWDQLQALRWVHANIDTYDGIVNQTVLIGHEAGATSAGYHLASPISRQYFTRVILMSGSSHRIMPNFPVRNVADVSEELLCPQPESKEALLECLRGRSLQSLINFELARGMGGAISFFTPSRKAIVTSDDQVRYTSGRKEVIVGFVSNEGVPYLSALLEHLGVRDEERINKQLATRILVHFLRVHGITLSKYILSLYFSHTSNAVEALSAAIGHFVVHCPVQEFVRRYVRSGNDVYVYHFQHVPSYRWWPAWMGAPQMLDWLYITGNVIHLRDSGIRVTKDDVALAQKLAALFSCFSIKGNPSGCAGTPLLWAKTSEQRVQHLVIASTTSIYMVQGMPYEYVCKEWIALIANHTQLSTRQPVGPAPLDKHRSLINVLTQLENPITGKTPKTFAIDSLRLSVDRPPELFDKGFEAMIQERRV
ncbi:cholinesterase 1-like [Ornithodoros turicata]|uniref:cholinesterase 1-like n=1 Tax=Ornithodoros turicata TaxID=34597 RepID=UPI00313A3852